MGAAACQPPKPFPKSEKSCPSQGAVQVVSLTVTMSMNHIFTSHVPSLMSFFLQMLLHDFLSMVQPGISTERSQKMWLFSLKKKVHF